MPHVIQHNQSVVDHLLRHFGLFEHAHFVQLSQFLQAQIRHSMTNTALYGISLDQVFPNGVPPENMYQYVSPYNLAVAMLTVTYSANNFGALPPPVASDLMIYAEGWAPFIKVETAQEYPLIYRKAAEPPAPAAPSPESAIADAMAALTGSSPAPAEPAKPTFIDEITQTAVAPTPEVRVEARLGAAFAYHQHAQLPAVDVMANRVGGKGRPAKSAFERTYEHRGKFGKPPYWYADFAACWPRLLADTPPNAATTDSSAPTMVMAYGLALTMLRDVLRPLAGKDVLVDDVLAWAREVDARITQSPSGNVAYDLVEALHKHLAEENSDT